MVLKHFVAQILTMTGNELKMRQGIRLEALERSD
jgi:hypothetical protein